MQRRGGPLESGTREEGHWDSWCNYLPVILATVFTLLDIDKAVKYPVKNERAGEDVWPPGGGRALSSCSVCREVLPFALTPRFIATFHPRFYPWAVSLRPLLHSANLCNLSPAGAGCWAGYRGPEVQSVLV